MNTFMGSKTILGALTWTLLVVVAGLGLTLSHHGGESWFFAVFTAFVVSGCLYDVKRLAGGRWFDLACVLFDVALYGAVLGAIYGGFLHFPIPTAILVGAGVIAGAIIYASRRR
jgi:hypothetical protein